MKYGFQYPTIQPKDYVLGASRSAPFEVINESGDWTAYLPDNEVQSRAGFDSNSCTAFGSTNLLEITQRYLQQIKTNYSERYVAVNSGQVRQGNDPHKVLEAIRSLGVVEDWKLPFLEGMTWETYFFPVPMNTELLNDGKEWVNQYYFKHEYIYPIGAPIKERQELLLEALKRSPVGVSVYAWNFDGEEYVKPDDAKDNHWTVLVGAKKGEYWLVYDSYENDGNFLKKLDWNSPFFDVAKGIYLRKKTEQERNEELSVFVKIFTAILNIFKLLADKKKAEEAPKTPAPEEPPVVSPPAPKVKDKAYFQSYTRSYCKDIGLSPEMTEKLMLTIQCESGWNPEAKNKNKDGTIDWGIAQLNSYWYIGAGRPCPSVEVAINDPEFCLRLMANQFKAGRAVDWICYRKLTN